MRAKGSFEKKRKSRRKYVTKGWKLSREINFHTHGEKKRVFNNTCLKGK